MLHIFTDYLCVKNINDALNNQEIPNVVYSVAKFDGKLVENFIEKENTDCYGAGSTACMEFCENCNE